MKQNRSETKKLHLGCFQEIREGWMNTDITPNLFIARIPFAADILHWAGIMNDQHYKSQKEGRFRRVSYLNVAKKFPFKHNTFDAVFCSHMLEHLYKCQAEHLFHEVFRVLKPGGIFRVSVPSLEQMLSAYAPDNPDAFLNGMYEYDPRVGNLHKWMYTSKSLKTLFEEHGFVEVKECNFGEGRLPDVEKMDSRPGGIFMEGLVSEKKNK